MRILAEMLFTLRRVVLPQTAGDILGVADVETALLVLEYVNIKHDIDKAPRFLGGP